MPYCMRMEAISKACEVLGESVAAFARRLGVQPPTVHEWISGERDVPPKRAIQIERETNGKITRADCRPNDFREIWPEFAEKLDRAQRRA